MLRRSSYRQPSTILPSCTGMDCSSSSQSSSYLGYGRSYSGSSNGDPYASRNSFGSSSYSLNSKRRSSYTSTEYFPSFFNKSNSWLGLGLAFFLFVSGYYQSKFQWVTRELNVNSLDEVVDQYKELYSDKLSRKQRSSELDERYTIMERLNAKLHKEKEDIKNSYEKKIMKEFTNRRREEDRLIARENAFKEQIKLLQDGAARDAKRAVEAKWVSFYSFSLFPTFRRTPTNILFPHP